jgi:hypothetical protein
MAKEDFEARNVLFQRDDSNYIEKLFGKLTFSSL